MRFNWYPVNTALCVLLSLNAISQDKYWQQQLKYEIAIVLNDVDHSLDGNLKLTYRNNSTDTLTFIWFHLWPNAFKNDRTAFSEQQLALGNTDFYFSGREQKGYINRLDFKSGAVSLEMEDHPLYADVVKLLLNEPLLPGATCLITTPFHVKLPYNFSRGGHNGISGQSYQLTQWYPKPAVYDARGWHPMPYLEQGEFYSEFGSYDVSITLPQNYVVAATGELQNEDEIAWLNTRVDPPVRRKIKQQKNKNSFLKPVLKLEDIPSDLRTKTLHYIQDSIHDFAIIADKYFLVRSSVVTLPSGKQVKASSFYTEKDKYWDESLEDLKEALLYRSGLNGDYPYNSISIVATESGSGGGMEYPMLATISPQVREQHLKEIIKHEVGHNWFSGMLASNERQYPWLDEGLNTFYDRRYSKAVIKKAGSITFMPQADDQTLLRHQIRKAEITCTDQPVNTRSEHFSRENYLLFAYQKPTDWLKSVEGFLGRAVFDTAMKYYVETWKFRHPAPQDFQASLEKSSGRDLSALFHLLDSTSKQQTGGYKKRLVPGLFLLSNISDSIDYIDLLPVPGYNTSDGFMIGAAVHNLSNPFNRFHFFISPLYATRSRQLNGIADFSYTRYGKGLLHKITPGLGFSRFSTLSGTDSNNLRISAGFIKITPSLRISFRNHSPILQKESWLEWKTYFIGETNFRYYLKASDGEYYPQKSVIGYRYLNQLTYTLSDKRVLYPYQVTLQFQQAKDFYRINLNAEYLFNYSVGGGMGIRLFASKFGYIGSTSVTKSFETARYQPKLTAVTGGEDYTYSDYFVGRFETDGIAGQQVMMRDGGLKLRTDLFQDLQGRSDDWVTSINLSTSIPPQILPSVIPLKLFLDVGTYAGAWKEDVAGSRFLYVAGLQLSLFRQTLNIYAPVIYSKAFSDNLKTVPQENKFFRKISFNIDMQQFHRLLSSRK